MYVAHPSRELKERFTHRPFQGVAPDQAMFLFVGLDANYDRRLQSRPIFARVLEYQADGVAFWKTHGVHHPFLLPDYFGDGRRYHRNFANLGFRPAHAALVSFVELLHVPTAGRSDLVPSDLSDRHLAMLDSAIIDGKARHIFLSATVARLMQSTGRFRWIGRKSIAREGRLGHYLDLPGKSVYSHLHFSVYGWLQARLAAEGVAIRRLVPPLERL